MYYYDSNEISFALKNDEQCLPEREELEAGLRAAMQSLETKGQRVAMLRQLAENMVYMNRLQGVPLVVRLAFFRAFFAVFNYLRQRRQLGRREGELDVEVRLEMEQILSKLLKELHTGTDPIV